MSAPVAGPLFRQAATLPVGGAKRRKLIALMAAYVDGGAERLPSTHELADRLGLDQRKVVRLADALVADGWLVRLPGRERRYRLGEWSA